MMRLRIVGIFWVALTLGAFASGSARAEQAMTVTSPAFEQGGMIPSEYTCAGGDYSPVIEWSGVPEGTQSLVLIMDDPDAPRGTWVHWLLYNIPASARGLPEKVPSDRVLADGSVHGKNSWPKYGYGGPCPPSGTHRYYFKVYALDTVLDLKPGAKKRQVLKAMDGHVLGYGELMGRFRK